MTDVSATETMSAAPKGAPWHLWVVGGIMTVWNAFGVFDYMATVVRFEPYLSSFPEEMLEYWFSFPLWMFVIWAIAVFGAFLGAVLVLLRRRLAVVLLGVSFAAALVSMAVSFLRPPPSEASGPADIIFPLVILAIAGLFVAYAVWMARRGVLR